MRFSSFTQAEIQKAIRHIIEPNFKYKPGTCFICGKSCALDYYLHFDCASAYESEAKARREKAFELAGKELRSQILKKGDRGGRLDRVEQKIYEDECEKRKKEVTESEQRLSNK